MVGFSGILRVDSSDFGIGSRIIGIGDVGFCLLEEVFGSGYALAL